MPNVTVKDIGSISVRSQRPETAKVLIGTGGGGVSQLKNLTDVGLLGVQDGYVLTYQANTDTFIFSPYVIDDGYF
jgi:hypothetical protein